MSGLLQSVKKIQLKQLFKPIILVIKYSTDLRYFAIVEPVTSQMRSKLVGCREDLLAGRALELRGGGRDRDRRHRRLLRFDRFAEIGVKPEFVQVERF